MLLILLIIVLVLVFGGGGGYYGYRRWGRRCRDWRVDPDYPVGFVPIRRIASVT